MKSIGMPQLLLRDLNKKMRIKFLANGPLTQGSFGYGDEESGKSSTLGRVVINMSYFMMKHYHTLHGKYQPTWLIQEFLVSKTASEQVDELIKDRVDLLLLSVFVWNMELQMEIAKLYRERVPHGRVVAGGPQLTAHKDGDFFKKHPYIDFVVYGDGEQALSNIIDYLATGEREPWVNTVENIEGMARLWPFEALRDEKYWSTSPYLTQKQFIRDSIASLRPHGFGPSQIMIAVEFARGCMYKCAYCDWSQNLTKKVLRRKAEWKLELEFFRDLDVSIRETDANFGSWAEDLAIYDYAKSLYDPNRNFKFLVWNTAKLKKNAHHFMIGNAETYGKRVVFSFEDTEKGPLEAMDRPSLSWQQHQDMISKVRHRLGKERFEGLATAELMLGMPEQSIGTFKENFKKILGEGITDVILSHWAILPNSPGADPEYLKRYGVEFKEHRMFRGYGAVPYDKKHISRTLDDVYKLAQSNPVYLRQSMVLRTNTMEYVDIVTVMIVGELIGRDVIKKKIRADRNHIVSASEIESIVDRLFDWAGTRATHILAQHKECTEKYGFILPLTYIVAGSFICKWSAKSLHRWVPRMDVDIGKSHAEVPFDIVGYG
jgi:hypothetical protein